MNYYQQPEDRNQNRLLMLGIILVLGIFIVGHSSPNETNGLSNLQGVSVLPNTGDPKLDLALTEMARPGSYMYVVHAETARETAKKFQAFLDAGGTLESIGAEKFFVPFNKKFEAPKENLYFPCQVQTKRIHRPFWDDFRLAFNGSGVGYVCGKHTDDRRLGLVAFLNNDNEWRFGAIFEFGQPHAKTKITTKSLKKEDLFSCFLESDGSVNCNDED